MNRAWAWAFIFFGSVYLVFGNIPAKPRGVTDLTKLTTVGAFCELHGWDLARVIRMRKPAFTRYQKH